MANEVRDEIIKLRIESINLALELNKLITEMRDEIMKLRLDFSRNAPIIGDRSVIHREKIVIPANSEGTILFDVPQGLNVYIMSWAGNYNPDSLWVFIVDDELIETRTAPPQSLQDQQQIYTPPIIAHSKIEIKIKNNASVEQEYIVEVRGWQRK